MTTPLDAYGFTYRCRGREFATHIEAASADEAMDHVRAMAGAEFVGKLLPAQIVRLDEPSEQVTKS